MIEIIPKPEIKLPFWQNILFYFSIALLLTLVIGYFVLNVSLKKSSKTLEDLENSLARGKTAEELSLEKEILGYQRKISDFASLIPYHKDLLNFFTILENLSHPQIQFSNLSLEPVDLKVVLSGKAGDFKAINQQIYLFQKEPLIRNVNLTSLLLGKEGGAEFTLLLFLDPQIFR